MQFAEIKPVDVRAELAKTPISSLAPTHKKCACYVRFWLQPQVFHADRWQGGEELLVKRVDENEFKIGSLPLMTLEQAAFYIERELDRYGVPYFGTKPWQHPFMYHI